MLTNVLKALPDFKGKRRLARYLFGNFVRDSRDVIIKGRNGMQFKVPNFIENVGFEILVNGIYEKDTSDFIAARLPQNGVFLDIGANIGAVALPVCNQRKDI